ncbi:YbaK/EbsC family protein [Vibrio sp. A8-1]|uniref:aminoacyl-tRNA deacylase n=1 Tax=Vibrio sp. A8-1 TaxID=2591023 RepID=UPI0014832CFE|nr:YbaK/EbsC family protein [Vibrio sp. A8-1]EKO3578009.1 YbaK/EbsC family protein [Vibrio metschnikovii]EKO3675473.1 YbaK/EbsC family protein [Vibrio metschnikovii]NNN84297.1 YbaK/EbsC family protein [Vibrio sp. A8-1]
MLKPLSTPIIRYLEQQGIDHQLLHHQSAAISIEDAARQRGIHPSQMVKCLLLRDMSNRLALACVPGDRSVDPKLVRKILDWRRMTCVDRSQVEALTGYTIGTVTPLCLSLSLPIIFDYSLMQHTQVTISSGSAYAGIALALNDLVKLCQPQFADIVRD